MDTGELFDRHKKPDFIGFACVGIGFDSVQWPKVAEIASSWVVSPIMAGTLSFFLYLSVKKFIFVWTFVWPEFKIYRKRGLSLITICISQDKEKTLEALKQAQISGYNFTSTFYQVSSVFNLSGLDGRATPCVVIINNKGAVETRFNGMPEIDVLKTKVINILNN